MNLLEETVKFINESGEKTDSVDYVGTLDGEYAITWEQFEHIGKDINYDSGYGAAEIVEDLAIRFNDGAIMIRQEYDGSEHWLYLPQQTVPREQAKSFTKVYSDQNIHTLEDLNRSLPVQPGLYMQEDEPNIKWLRLPDEPSEWIRLRDNVPDGARYDDTDVRRMLDGQTPLQLVSES